MRPIFSASAALLLAGTVLSSAAWAQTAVTPRQEQAGLPAGPYLLSCAHPHMVNGRLVALCDDQTNAMQGQGSWHRAQLPNAQQCNGSVENVNGQLTCGTAPMVGSSTPPQTYGSSFGTAGSAGYPYTPGSPYRAPYTTYPGNSAFNSPPGYPNGQPVPPANKPYPSPQVGSSLSAQPYGSSLGTSGPAYGYHGGGPVNNPATPAYSAGTPGYPNGQPVPPANKPNYSRPS